jgi:hypothetical protein
MLRAGLLLVAAMMVLTGCSLWSDAGSTAPTPTDTAVAIPAESPTAAPTSAPTPMAIAPTPTMPAVASPNPNLEPSARLAYFHITPVDGAPVETLAARARIITLTHGDEHYRDQLRAAGYAGLVLQYVVASQVNGPGPLRDASEVCDAGFRPLRNGIARDPGQFCAEIHPNEDWFLHSSAGERLYERTGQTGVWYLMNPASEGWRSYAVARLAADLSGPNALGFDGLFLDNVELSDVKARELLDNSDGSVQEFETNAAYRQAWIDYLAVISASVRPAAPVWANMVADPNTGDAWDPYMEYLDGGMFPAFATGYDALSVPKWTNNLVQAESVLAAGKGVIAVGIGSRDDLDRQQFALASYLLITNDTSAYFRYVSNASGADFNSFWLYPNYDVTLGEPLAPRYRVGQTWRRDFACGYVVVSASQRSGEIVQTECAPAS